MTCGDDKFCVFCEIRRLPQKRKENAWSMGKNVSFIQVEWKNMVRDSWQALRKKYFMNVLIVFIVAVVVGGYSFSTKNAVIGSDTSVEDAQIQAVYDRATGKSNAEVIENLINETDMLQVDTRLASTTAEKYTHGVVSVFVNEITSSGSVGFGILNGVNTLVFNDSLSRSIVIFCFAALLLVFNTFVRNVLIVGQCRYFLEHRRYSETKADCLLFAYKFGKTRKVAKVMFIRYVRQFLWNLTIIGGFVKRYEYSMIPYILAENPEIEWREAFRLSKEMTMGEKKRLFGFDIICFIGYAIASFTFNFLNVFFINPFKECTLAEIYMNLREHRTDTADKEKYLKDTALATAEVSDEAYPDSAYQMEPVTRRSWVMVDYGRKYKFTTLVMFFFTFAFVGWAWEVFYTLLNNGILANRGTMLGPWLPIYGVGGIIIIVLLKPFRRNPLLMFLVTIVACGTLEYFTSWILEVLFHTKWWDYTGFFLNLNGRVCLEGLLVFGMAGLAFTYICAPMLDNLYRHLTLRARRPICITLAVLFLLDLGWSAIHPNQGTGVTCSDEKEETTVTETVETKDELIYNPF